MYSFKRMKDPLSSRVWMSNEMSNDMGIVRVLMDSAQEQFPTAVVSNTLYNVQSYEDGYIRVVLMFKTDADEAEFILQNFR